VNLIGYGEFQPMVVHFVQRLQISPEGGKNMKLDERSWKIVQKHLGYTDEEMKKFKENPRNEDVFSKAPALMNKTIVVTVVDSHGCNSQHKAGDKFYFDGAGNLITKLCPNRICIYALNSIAGLIFVSNELFYAGINPNEMRFKERVVSTSV
jgi:uncharacterized repeat protein (TIGR04076 family)